MEKLLNYLGYPADDLCYQIEAEEAKIAEAKAQLKDLRCLSKFVEMYNKLKDKKLFLELAHVMGCKPYHTEGNALVHTFLVFKEMYKICPDNEMMLLAALLHDVGKIETGHPKNGDMNDWEYPNHSGIGATMLYKFIPLKHPNYDVIQWLIFNHIKPLFWQKKGTIDIAVLPPDGHEKECTLENLALLALCDIKGSISTVPQKELEDFLETIAYSNEIAKGTFGHRRVIGIKNGKFIVHVMCRWCNSMHEVEVPIQEYIDFVIHKGKLTSFEFNTDEYNLLSELWCNCDPIP